MKHVLKRTLIVILALLPCLSVLGITSSDGPSEIPLKPVVPGSLQPRSLDDLNCYYLDGCVYILGDASVTSISGTVTRLSDNMQWSDSSNGNTLQISVPATPGTYCLTLTLSDGSSYYGDYAL